GREADQGRARRRRRRPDRAGRRGGRDPAGPVPRRRRLLRVDHRPPADRGAAGAASRRGAEGLPLAVHRYRRAGAAIPAGAGQPDRRGAIRAHRPGARAAARVRRCAVANAIVFAHASASTGRQWSALAGGFGTRYRVLAPDFAGGVSGDSLEQDIAVLGDAIAAAAGPVHLIGHSYGGAVAILAALRDPQRV